MTSEPFGALGLPGVTTSHDPGGKVKTALPPGLRGDAVFSPCERYRHLLRRWVGDRFPERFILFIGMNPSTASATHNDPTITREWGFTTREGFQGYAKVNIGDYRATKPEDLLKPDTVACSPENLPTILKVARDADRVVLCYGKVNRALTDAAVQTVQALQDLGIDLWCFGTNQDGSPRHPLYLPGPPPLVRFTPPT